jgi:hypothetical protein
VRVRALGLSGVYTDPGHVMVYLSGEIRQQFALCFHALPLSGHPHPDYDETIGVAWFTTTDLAALDIHPSVRIKHALDQSDTVHLT